MKPFFFLAFLLSLPAFPASPVQQQIRVDLDGDGRADRVSRVVRARGGDLLVVQLSRSGKTLRYAGWLRDTVEQARHKVPCQDWLEDNLMAGANGTFEWTQMRGNYDACATQTDVTYRFAFDGSRLVVRWVRHHAANFSAGDPSYRSWSEADYLTCKERSADWERHEAEPAPTEKDLGAGCSFPLEKIGR